MWFWISQIPLKANNEAASGGIKLPRSYQQSQIMQFRQAPREGGASGASHRDP